MFLFDAKQFGLFLIEQRRQNNLNQKQLADKLHIPKEELTQWELGHSLPKCSLLIPLAKALNIMVAELLECRRFMRNEAFSLEQVEKMVRTVIEICVTENQHGNKYI